ncbi:hypothetical protein LCGC14_1369920 [marine sediment metagenome]|uniref:Uncharacterized protein n=1 Tax=marine sediment metagenome TaxID=412755 RepID=A0A0F9K623_9ZZZZ
MKPWPKSDPDRLPSAPWWRASFGTTGYAWERTDGATVAFTTDDADMHKMRSWDREDGTEWPDAPANPDCPKHGASR